MFKVKTIRARLFLMGGISLLLLLLFGVLIVIEQISRAREMASIRQLVELAVRNTALIHEIQEERGAAAMYLGSGGQKFGERFNREIELTDRSLETYFAFLGGFKTERFGENFQADLLEIRRALDELRARRQSAKTLSISVGEMIGYFTKLNQLLLNNISLALSVSHEGEVNRDLQTYLFFLTAKETFALERGILAGAFAAGQFQPGQRDSLVGVLNREDAFLQEFLRAAPTDIRNFYHEKVTGRDIQEADRIRNAALVGNLAFDPEVWFNTKTEQIKLMKSVDDRLAADILKKVNDKERDAWITVGILVTFILVAVIGLGIYITFMVRNITGSVNHIVTIMGAMGEGNLGVEADRSLTGEHGTISNSLNRTLDAFNDILGQLTQSMRQMKTTANQIAESSQSLSQGATEQAASVEEITSAIAELASQSKQSAANSEEVNRLSRDSRDSAVKGATMMDDMVGAMREINESSNNIARILKSIDEIAFQTNLLALNAAVEAARAGVHGRGFAVVAEEVKNLSQRSAKAARETADLIDESMKRADNGTRIATSTADALRDIQGYVERVASLVNEISIAANEQVRGISQIEESIQQIEEVTQQTAANAEETAAGSEELSGQAIQLNEMISRFKLRSIETAGTNGSHPHAPVAKEHFNGNGGTRGPVKVTAGSNGHPARATRKLAPEEVISLEDQDFAGF